MNRRAFARRSGHRPPAACAAFAEAVAAAGLGVITFTGHVYEQLLEQPAAKPLLGATDLLVDGPYMHSSPETSRALVGSNNQRFHHLTERYSTFDPSLEPNRIDVGVAPDGSTRVAGFLRSAQVRQLGR